MNRTVLTRMWDVCNKMQSHLGCAAEIRMAASILQFQHEWNAPHLHLLLAFPASSVCVGSRIRDIYGQGTLDINRRSKIQCQSRLPKLKPKAFRQICLFGQSRKPWNICSLLSAGVPESQLLTSVDCLVRKNFRFTP